MSKQKPALISWFLTAFILLGQILTAVSPVQGASSVNVTPVAAGLQVSGHTTTPWEAVGLMVTQGERRVYLNQIKSGTDGAFTCLIPLAAGSYTVQVSAVGQSFAPAEGTVVSGEDGGPIPPPDVSSQATVSIIDDNGDMLTSAVVTWQGKATALSLLRQVADAEGLSLEVRGGYVVAIDGLREFAQGPTSGWKYRVNGDVLGVGASSYTVNDGDVIEWYYVTEDKQAQLEQVLAPVLELPGVPKQELLAAYLKNLPHLGEWGALGLWLGGEPVVSDYSRTLTAAILEKAAGAQRITDLQRQVILASAMGLDPANIAGRDLLSEIYNSEQLTRQGTNGVAYGLLALDSCQAQLPPISRWTRESMVDWLLNEQHASGAWALTRTADGDVDITAMTLTALAPYQSQSEVQAAIDKAINWLSEVQLLTGGFQNSGVENSESSSQLIIALCSLGISPAEPRFVKGENSLFSRWTQYQQADGGFAHELGQASNATASEQALLALIAYQRYQKRQSPIFQYQVGEPGMFNDGAFISLWAKSSVEKAYQMGIIKGAAVNPARFAPKKAVTRAELMVMLTRLQLPSGEERDAPSFEDIEPGIWYEEAVKEAAGHGWVAGTSSLHFEPLRAITRQELAMIIVRVHPALPQVRAVSFSDMDQAYPDARAAIAQAAASGIMIGADNKFDPTGVVSREMAVTILIRFNELVAKSESL